ncbi:nuclear pore complex protein Nup93-1 [Scaptodrosophila lebanonensis]|uniref:Nuclear pore protein n=1 Tax=Drosophila lebanonensis TaxID=7225 RepID=A0A6J2TG99_DROLE|nr:nuclear pore complex protein Nup93-1 [Scaptodrosophila lebanonensis]
MDFNTLLQRAQCLVNGNNCETPRVARTLQQVLQGTEQMHARITQTGGKDKDIQAHILLGSQGVDLPKLNQKLEALSTRKTFEPVDATSTDTDVSTFLKNERENAILSVIEDTNKNISETVSKQKWEHLICTWNQEKTRLLDALIGPSQNFIDLQRLPEYTILNPQCPPISCLSRMELLYAQELRQYNDLVVKGAPRPHLVQKFSQVAISFGDPRLSDMWTLLACVTQVKEPQRSDPIKERQQRWEFVQHARSYLERRYKTYMHSIVGGSGGRDNYQLLHAYVSKRFSEQHIIGLVDPGCGKLLWPLVYYSLRCGSVSTAISFLQEAGNSCEEFAQLIVDREAGVINSKMESRLKLQYANKIKNSTDSYKKAVYCIILSCDPNEVHSEVAKTIDDFLWIKLAMLRVGDAQSYSNLQCLILEKYGEKYFNAKQQAHLYFQTLALTGQFEAAIEFLARTQANRSHAVHMAIALHELGVLGGARSVTQPLLTIDIVDPPPLRRLNLSRLIRLYVQRFERTDTAEALHYYYTLRGLCDANGRNMFLACVCELVVESGVLDTSIFDLIFGQREANADGGVGSGLFQQFDCPDFNSRTTAGLVGDELVRRGNFEMALRLYDIAGKYNEALKQISILLAQTVAQPPAEGTLRARLSVEVEQLDKRLTDVEPKVHATYELLKNLLHFFDKYHERKPLEALELLKRTQLIPNNCEEVDSCVANIKLLSGEVIKVLPDVMVATLEIGHTLYKNLKEGQGPKDTNYERKLLALRERAKAVANMAATMPYRMPFDNNQRLVQLELLMH